MNPLEIVENLKNAECVVTLCLIDEEISLLINGNQETGYEMIKMTAFALKNKQITES
jgi:hypothetical protein